MKRKIYAKKKEFLIVIISIIVLIPTITATSYQEEKKSNNYIYDFDNHLNINTFDMTKTIDQAKYIPFKEAEFSDEQNDIGYNQDGGRNARRSVDVYVGEPVDKAPGRGRTGQLLPSQGDSEDCYRFFVCEGQSITASFSTTENYDFELINHDSEVVDNGYVATETKRHYIHIYANEDASDGEYSFDVQLIGQNDSGTGNDAGDNINQATNIIPGSYYGYLDYNDVEDWYSFNVNSGEGIFVTVDPLEYSDYDINLYNPYDELVHSIKFYGEDELEYPADVTGTWKIKIDIFPGWDANKWPDDYFLYGSGPYDLELTIGGSSDAPPIAKSQPYIKPVAQTFLINDDPLSNKDEYGYLAAVPAANYFENGQNYISPILYQGVNLIPNWFTTIDETTQYLIDDWNDYLDRHGMEAVEYTIINDDPIQAAADIATKKWTSSETAVIATDGSEFIDTMNTVLDKDAILSSSNDITIYQPSDLKEISGYFAAPMFIGPKWCAIHVIAEGENFEGDTLVTTPRYEALMGDWWPHGDDYGPGDDKDTFFPLSQSGLWMPHVTDTTNLDEMKVIKYSGDRYTIPVENLDCSIEVTLTTDNPSQLIVYLIDPEGNIRRPSFSHWNGGEIKPLHQWHGGHWEDDYEEYQSMIIEPHTEFSASVNNAIEGKWTAIVVPFLNHETGEAEFDGQYHITVNIREYNSKRISAGLSAANGAVIASMKHAPLLYVNEDSIPVETSNALSDLGVTNIIFVNIDDVSSVSLSGSVVEYNTMQEVINTIKSDSNSENYITITSFATGDGYFAPSGMIAAYHGSPVLNIAEVKEAYNTVDMIITWREYDGDYYHGCRSIGALPMMDEPIKIDNPPSYIDLVLYFFTNDRTFPPTGLDLKLQWFSTVHNAIYNMIDGYGLDGDGQEAYLFVSPRDTDIRDPISRIMMGNNSYAGQIPVETAAFSSAIICRNILYPAIIYANPGRDITTSQHMNFFTGQFDHNANDGNQYTTDASKDNKNSFSSHGRFYEGHCMWDNLLERFNNGVSICLYSGHGTGGSGISSQYKNIAEQFPLAEPTHENLYDFEWWDAWR